MTKLWIRNNVVWFLLQVVVWVCDHMQDGDKKKQLKQLIADKKFKVNYMKYDWSVNSK